MPARNSSTAERLVGRLVPAVGAIAADQLIERSGAPMAVAEGVGRLRYVQSDDHEHWHLLDLERYELRRVGGMRRVTDRKTGFSLGDRYRNRGRALPAEPPTPRYTSCCGLGATGRLHLVEGISVGYGDDYPANLEGQSLPLSGLAAGRYLLVHRAQAKRTLGTKGPDKLVGTAKARPGGSSEQAADGIRPTTFCMASRVWGTGVGYNVPANRQFLPPMARSRMTGISRRIAAI